MNEVRDTHQPDGACCLCGNAANGDEWTRFTDQSWAHAMCYEDLEDYSRDLALMQEADSEDHD